MGVIFVSMYLLTKFLFQITAQIKGDILYYFKYYTVYSITISILLKS